MATGTAAPLPAGAAVGAYTVTRVVAAGGFSIVYLGADREGRSVALKEYLPLALAERSAGQLAPTVRPDHLPLYQQGLRAFFDEGLALARISHPGVVTVRDFVRANETVYLAMDALQGRTLQSIVVDARAPGASQVMPERAIRSLFAKVVQGLQAVHANDLLHLDIKPANIFVTDDGRAVLLDFGAVRHRQAGLAGFARPSFTPGFAAPELARRDMSPGVATDIYAVGACLFACMTAQPPPDAVRRRAGDELSDRLAALDRRYSDDLLGIVAWCMALEPEGRPRSVEHVRRALVEGPGG